MTLPYQRATSGRNAMHDIEKILRGFGCTSFGHMMDFSTGDLLVQFEYRAHKVSVRASAKGYAAAWLREHPYAENKRTTKARHEIVARRIGDIAVYSILRDWIKGQMTAISAGILSFEGAFLGQIVLPNGRTMLEHTQAEQLLEAP